MSGRGEKNDRSLTLTRRGAVQLALGAALLATGIVGGWLAPGAAGIALLAGCVTGLAEVLLARRLRARGTWSRLVETSARVESWVRVNQRGEVIESLSRPGSRRGLYRQQSVRHTWVDAFGFWHATRVDPAALELRVPPAVSPDLLRSLQSGRLARLTDPSPEPDPSGVRPYEKGDGIRQISWRQTAHHGELMSFERSGHEAPPVLVVADTLGAGTGDELAATTAAVLQGLRNNPDVILTDGSLTLRAPVQQERFCASVVGEHGDASSAEARARGVARLAGGGSGRRRVVLVTCDPDGALARTLQHGPLAAAVIVVSAERGARAGEASEGAAEKSGDVARATSADAPARTHAAAELLALLAGVALALLATVPLTSMIYEGVWGDSVPALLCAGAAGGALLGSLLRRRGARRPARVALPAALAVALVVVGAALALGALDGRVGHVATTAVGNAAGQAVWDEPLAWLGTVVSTGAEQLAGGGSQNALKTWDILVVLMGSGLAALLAALCSSRSLRPVAALVPLGLSAADQVIMGPAARLEWIWAAVALGLLLVWLSVTTRPRPVRGAAVALLALALGWGASVVAPSGAFERWAPGGDGPSVPTRVETLVDLSADLRDRSPAQALTYVTTADRPLYLRLGALDEFDGSTWRFAGISDTDLEDGSGIYWEGTRGGSGSGLLWFADESDAWLEEQMPYVTTSVEAGSEYAPVPPGTCERTREEDGTVTASGCYLAPLTSDARLDDFERIRAGLGESTWAGPSARTSEVPNLPRAVQEVADEARSEGAIAADGDLEAQVSATRWLMRYFAEGGFSYSLDAPDRGGENNLQVVADFLTERRGYCTHYATAFALLARTLGLSSRVALGYAPGSERDADGSYVVRMNQLHTWAEVWFDGIGWVGIDVTPASGEGEVAPEPQETPETTLPADEPDSPGEDPAGPEAETPEEDAPDEQGEKNDASALPWQAVVLLAVALTAAGTGAAVLLARRRKLSCWRDAWTRVCRTARHSGVRWDPSATEDEVCRLVCERLGNEALAAEVRTICRNACQERYGGHPAPFKQPPLQAIARTLRHRRK